MLAGHLVLYYSQCWSAPRVTAVAMQEPGFIIVSTHTLLYTNSVLQVVISNGKTPSTNQRSSSNIYELESSKSLFESKASVSLDTEESEAPDYGFTFNITMIFPQGKSGA